MNTFDWDGDKNRKNLIKHRIAFEEAMTVFLDENAVEIFDRTVDGEDRYAMIGVSSNGRVLTVCFCLRRFDTVIRIISARKATSSEQKEYREIL